MSVFDINDPAERAKILGFESAKGFEELPEKVRQEVREHEEEDLERWKEEAMARSVEFHEIHNKAIMNVSIDELQRTPKHKVPLDPREILFLG